MRNHQDHSGSRNHGGHRQQPLFPVVLLSIDGVEEPEEPPTAGE